MDKNEIVEVKIKWADEIGKRWEDIEVMCQMTFAAVLSTKWNKDIWEVRFNQVDSPQGHYIGVKKGFGIGNVILPD